MASSSEITERPFLRNCISTTLMASRCSQVENADSPRKVAIVTGGARGIGRACAYGLARAGFAIALVDLLEAEMAVDPHILRLAGFEIGWYAQRIDPAQAVAQDGPA